MKAIMLLFKFIGRLISYIWPSFFYKVFCSIRDKIYTGYVERRFAHFGNSIVMWKPYHLMGEQYVSIGDNCIVEPNTQLTARKIGNTDPSIRIGNNCLLRYGTHITATNNITIGDNLLTGTNVFITDNSHGETNRLSLEMSPRTRPIISKGKVCIGNNVWLGNNVCILPKVTIGDGVIVGANSIVAHDVPPYTIVGGIPARIIHQYINQEQ
jgi:acetyltransferase-like isoleucine patch superfamily enzyme